MSTNRLRVYVGYDSREKIACDVAAKSAREYGCDVTPLYEERLRLSGMLTRPTDRRGNQQWDFNSNAAQSTDFAIARFFVPLLAHDGWCLFADGDVVFLGDPHSVLEHCDRSKALMCVQHKPMNLGGSKMDGQVQTSYYRKLWSSVVLYNCDHVANRRLNLTMLNQWPGRDLHAFKWLHDDEIGELPARFNWLVGLIHAPQDPVIAHFTLGTPNMPGHENDEHADLWLSRTSER